MMKTALTMETKKRRTRLVATLLALAVFLLPALPVRAHPHVFVEANLEILRDSTGAATEIRHVWRFDELFSSTVLLDFDGNGDGVLDDEELQEVAGTVKKSIADYNFYTEVRNDGAAVDFYEPDPFFVDYQDGQIIMILALELAAPQKLGDGFKVAVSDPTYYVAIEIADQGAVQVGGVSAGCGWDIQRPDFDALFAANQQTQTEDFFASPEAVTLGSDEYLTWVEFACN